ncbi:MAG: hypothetical protein PQJ61_15190 [Spirochaetales bacterium]|uniref:Uncharacterized protein n=1 Tax=Candidatus Thalassospirochaeta sargassi TaxID=3119039 RepID=A0AAJ1MKR9_9SPIO|nr:hypothetical protein [Spirochaetales bacterium]
MKQFMLIILLLFSAAMLSAQVVRLPHPFYPEEFSQKTSFINDVYSWMSIRHVINQDKNPDFGHDWETGVNISFFSSPKITVRGISEETFHFKAAPEGYSDWIFNTQSLVSDLRLMICFNLVPVLVSGGFQHDCRHDVDHAVTRQIIHDSLFLFIRPSDEINIIGDAIFSIDLNTALEGAINLPAVFQDAAPQPDIGHFSLFLRLKGSIKNNPGIAVVLDGTAGLTKREENTRVSGIKPWGFDFTGNAGLALTGAAGEIKFFMGTERLTDTWTDYNETAVQIHYITLELAAGNSSLNL